MTELEKHVNAPNFLQLKEENLFFTIILKADIIPTADNDYIYIDPINNKVVPFEQYIIYVQKEGGFKKE